MTARNTRRRAGGWYCRIVLALGPRTDRMADPKRLQRESAGDLGFSSSRGPGHWAPKGPTAHATRRVVPRRVPNLGTSASGSSRRDLLCRAPSITGADRAVVGSLALVVCIGLALVPIPVMPSRFGPFAVGPLPSVAVPVRCHPCSLPSLFHLRARSLVANLDQGRATPPSPEDQCPQPSASCPHRPCRPASGSPCT
jgi:hypothetical protein